MFLCVFIIAGLVILGIYFARRTGSLKGDEALILVHDTRHTHGRAVGAIIKEEILSGNRIKYHFVPFDLNIEEYSKLDIETIICRREQLVITPRKIWSSGRTIVQVLPHNVHNIPEIFHTQNLSPLFKRVSESHDLSIRYDALQQQIQRIYAFVEEVGMGEWSELTIGKLKEMMEHTIKLKDDMDKKKNPGLPPMPHS